MEKLDLTKAYKSYYSASALPELLDIGEAQYIAIDGEGDPSGPEFGRHIEALYSTAYTVKFDSKARGKDFTVAKLEGLWSFDYDGPETVTMANAPLLIPRSEWKYTLLIRLPEFISGEDVLNARETVYKKKQLDLIGKIYFHQMTEGICVQILHTGPFSTELASLDRMMDFLGTGKYEQNGRHHEIYLPDFRKTPSEKLKTILREPVKKK